MLDSIGSTVGKILKGLLCLLCHIAAVAVALFLGIIQKVAQVLTQIAQWVWDTVRSITGFIWENLVAAAKHPGTWLLVTGAGAGVALACPPAGAVLAGIGALGMIITCE